MGQQTGFRRVKRGFGLPKAGLSAEDLALTATSEGNEDDFDSHVVHDEEFFNRLQYSANHRGEKRGYNPLKVENLVHLPPQVDPTDPLFQHQWYLVRFICGGIFFE